MLDFSDGLKIISCLSERDATGIKRVKKKRETTCEAGQAILFRDSQKRFWGRFRRTGVYSWNARHTTGFSGSRRWHFVTAGSANRATPLQCKKNSC